MFYQHHLRELDTNLQPLLHAEFFFVNVGANDGVLNDPIYPFIAKYGWRGIAVEPAPHVFTQLESNYRDLPGVILEQVAVSDKTRPFWYVQQGSGSAEFAVQQLGSLKEEYVFDALRRLRFVPNQGPVYEGDPPPATSQTSQPERLVADGVESFVQKLDVECVPFNDLMTRHDVEHIDFLNIDAEGCDFEILNSVDFDRYGPKVLCIELAALSEEELKALSRLLDDHGYVSLQDFGIHSHIYTRRE